MMQVSEKNGKGSLMWGEDFDVMDCLGSESCVTSIHNNSEEFSQTVLRKPSIIKQLLKMSLVPEEYEGSLSLSVTYNAIEVVTSFSSDVTLYCIQQLLPWVLELEVGEGTPLSNFVRILSTLLYHHPTEFIAIIGQHTPHHLLLRLNNVGVVDFLLRLMETDDEVGFYHQEKINILKQTITIIKGVKQQFLPEYLEAYAGFLEGLAQKTEDRFDGSKFVDFLKETWALPQLTDFILVMYEQHESDEEIGPACMQVIEAFLHFTIPESCTPLLTTQFLSAVGRLINGSKLAQDSMFLMYYLQSLKRLVQIDGISLKQVVLPELFQKLLKLFSTYPSNTILHNLIKDIMIHLIGQNPHYFGLMLVQNDSIFLSMLLTVTPANSAVPMENAIFHIYNALRLTSYPPILDVFEEERLVEAVEKLEKKKKFYEMKICGDPRVDSDRLESSDEFVMGGAGLEILKGWGLKETHSDDAKSEDLPLSSNDSADIDDLELKENSAHSLDLNSHQSEQQQQLASEEASFMKHFHSYLDFDVDSLVEEMDG